MAGKVVNIKVYGSRQHHLGLIANSSEVRHYAYTKRYCDTKSYYIIVLQSVTAD